MSIIKIPNINQQQLDFITYKSVVSKVNQLEQTFGNQHRQEKNRYKFAKIVATITGTIIRYSAKEVSYDDSTSAWIDIVGGLKWDEAVAGELNYLVPMNQTDTFSVNQVVQVGIDPNNRTQWIILSTAGGGSSIVPVILYSKTDYTYGTIYKGNIYANGLNMPYTESSQEVRYYGLRYTYGNPNYTNQYLDTNTGNHYECYKQRWQDPANPTGTKLYYTIIGVARWLQ
jgi:hypothetical protein